MEDRKKFILVFGGDCRYEILCPGCQELSVCCDCPDACECRGGYEPCYEPCEQGAQVGRV